MNLYEKIIALYPSLVTSDFIGIGATIHLQNDGAGDYIKFWEHPTLAKPTQEQLDGVK